MHKKERKKSTFWKDFKAFISRGNIVDLAIGLVVGAAFTAIVNSLVNDIIKPLIALLVDGDFSELVVVLREAVYDIDGVTVLQEAITLNYGNLIMAILTFLIDAFVIFTAEENAEQAAEIAEAAAEPAPAPAPEPAPAPSVEQLLAEIRDLLKAQKESEAAPQEKDKE